MSEGKQAEEQSTASTPALEDKATVSPVSSDHVEAEAGRVSTVLQDGLH